MIPEKVKQNCDNSFKNHKATLIQNTDRYLIIDWRNANGGSNYYVNYILDKQRGSLIVSGDLGDSIATWYNRVEPSKLKNWIKNDIEYYLKKIQCASDKYYYDTDDVLADLKQQLKYCSSDELIEAYNDNCYYSANTEDDVWKNLEDDISACIYGSDFIPNKEIENFCESLDPDYWEWLHCCGKRIATRVYFWADGFYKACNQLGI